MSFAFVAALLLSPPSQPGRASAPQLPARLHWEAPPGCPDATALARELAPLTVDATLTTELAFVIERSGTGPYTLTIGGRSPRYTAARCEDLVETALLLVSLALVPTSIEPEPAPSPSAARRPSARERQAEADEVAPLLQADPRPPVAGPLPPVSPGRVRVESGLAAVITPRLAYELAVAAGPRGRGWAVDLGLLARPAFTGPSEAPEVVARLSTWGALARVCLAASARRFTLGACAGLELAGMTARARGPVAAARPATRPWLAVELGPDLAVPLGPRLALVGRVSGTWLAVAPQFAVAGAGVVCCRDTLGVSARIGVELGLGEFRR